jgi:hypothetical protein
MDANAILRDLIEAAEAQDVERYQELSDELYGCVAGAGARPSIDDSQALDQIQAALTGQMWSLDTLDSVRLIVVNTGRTVDEP